MTRANTEQLKHTPWFAKAGAACSIVPISRFVGAEHLRPEGRRLRMPVLPHRRGRRGLTDQELESRVRRSRAHCADCRKARACISTRE